MHLKKYKKPCQLKHSTVNFIIVYKTEPTRTFADMSSTAIWAAFFTMGVMRPLSVATATEMSTLSMEPTSSPCHTEFTFGTR